MVEMLDYHLHYALMATQDRVRDLRGGHRQVPLRPRRRIHLLPRRRQPGQP